MALKEYKFFSIVLAGLWLKKCLTNKLYYVYILAVSIEGEMSIRSYQDVSRFWFMTSVSSLGLACCLAVILIVSRMPLLGAYFDTETFQSALVLHVNFSLFIWLFSFAAAVWVFYFANNNMGLHRLILFSSIVAISGILAASLLHDPRPVLSNYLPVLDNGLYLGSVLLFCTGFIALLVFLLLSRKNGHAGPQQVSFCHNCLGSLMKMMLICLLLLPWVASQISFEGLLFYEFLFWGVGHQIQYLFTLFMIWGWIWLAKKSLVNQYDRSLAVSDRVLSWCFHIALLPLFLSLFLPFVYAPESEQYRYSFTYLMYSSPLVLPVFIYAVYGGANGIQAKLLATPGIISLALGLLIVGLLLGTLIDGNNLMVPAHYHAVTGAINLTFMAIAYELMPKIGFTKPGSKWQIRQQQIYAGGVALLALGLAWSGSLGGVRKMVEHNSDSLEQISALVIIALGGLISLLGCFLFLGLAFSNMRKKSAEFALSSLSKTSFIKSNQDG